MKYVLDASAALAALLNEPGGDSVEALLDDSTITAVNLAETISKLLRLGIAADDVGKLVAALSLRVAAVNEQDGIGAGLMAADARRFGLSLGDRICLAFTTRRDLIALTADRAWVDAAPVLGAKVELIR